MTFFQSNLLLRLMSRPSLRPNKLTSTGLQVWCKQAHPKLLWRRLQLNQLKHWPPCHNSQIQPLSQWHRQDLSLPSILVHTDNNNLLTSRHQHQNNKYNSYRLALPPQKWTWCQSMPPSNLRNKTNSKSWLELTKVSLRQQQLLQHP